MPLNGSTVDWLLEKRLKTKKDRDNQNIYSIIENIRNRLGDASLLVIDEISMMGCSKFIELDNMLKKAKICDLAFGGLDVLLVGDFEQLPAVKQRSLHNALVLSTNVHIAPEKIDMEAATRLARFRKFKIKRL